MQCQSLYSGEKKKNISICYLLKLLCIKVISKDNEVVLKKGSMQ